MLVLGLNGWGDRTHDSSACLIVDGQIAAFAEEERFTRIKHGFDTSPTNAARFCLNWSGVELSDIDVVAFGWDIPRLAAARNIGTRQIDPDLRKILPRELFPRDHEPQVEYVDHHLAHAASAYLYSGSPSAAVLVIDGQGETASATAYHARDGKLSPVWSYPVGWSLGYFYEAACAYAGMRTFDAGKLMGLAAHGTPSDALDDLIRVTDHGYECPTMGTDYIRPGYSDEQAPILAAWMRQFEDRFALPPNVIQTVSASSGPGSTRDTYEYRDMAATVQQQLEKAVLAIAADVLKRTGEQVLAVAGGVAFNATLNGKLRGLDGLRELFVQPVAGDAGVALGAAALIASSAGSGLSPLTTNLAYGPEYGDDQVQATLEATGVAFSKPDDIAQAAADRIERGCLIGWFQGRAEVGPRALGSRSLLSLPSHRATRDRVNLEAKRREGWRPLAPSLQLERAPEILGGKQRLPFMVETAQVVDEFRPLLEAVVHEDGSTRPQTVEATTLPLFHDLLGRLPNGIALNTSFNGRDEPIVSTPEQALRTAHALNLDALAIGPFLIEFEDDAVGVNH